MEGSLVRSVKPCHPGVSSFNTSLTKRCCFTTLWPRNASEITLIAYICPHPPDVSTTSTSTALSAWRNLSSSAASVDPFSPSLPPTAASPEEVEYLDAEALNFKLSQCADPLLIPVEDCCAYEKVD
eukprot:TRINITY_DN17991_c0_g1_i3.p2 TRINITY_DN17991_c0_g1~~TRINITY_DN17991_c0_g1_i3.p2  ORF type:complete len:126 (+),score=12.28 TRINITY_DN17991_c0_g1_i3:429-806(+)